MNGVIIDKHLVPAQIQKKVPFYLFNNFDKAGGFYAAQQNVQVQPGMFFLYSYVNDASYNFLDFQIGNTINGQLRSGDVILVLGDDPILPNFLCHVVIHSDYVSYASFVANMQGKNYKISRIQYVTDNELNWSESFHTLTLNDFGLAFDNQLQPIAYRHPYEFTLGLLDMDIAIDISDKQGINSYMQFATDQIELTFYVDSIEQLINSQNNSSNGNSNSTPRAVLYEVR
jgi:hypothetical protein